MDQTITLDRKTFEALAIDTRVTIMKALLPRRKTQSELSKELGLAVSTVSEHLHKMNDAGLVIPIKWGKKWVYYQLTPKASQILQPKLNAAFVFMLAISLFMIVLGGSNLVTLAPAAVAGAVITSTAGSAPETASAVEGAPLAFGDFARKMNNPQPSSQTQQQPSSLAPSLNLAAAFSAGAGLLLLAGTAILHLRKPKFWS